MGRPNPAAGIGVFPLDRLGSLVVLGDVAHELVVKVTGGGEDAAVDEVAFDLAEPEFDLVEPRGVGGGEVQVDVLMQGQELGHPLGLVSRDIVKNDVNLLARRLLRDDGPKEGHELLAGVSRSCLSNHRAGLGVESGEQGEGPFADVFEPVALAKVLWICF